MSLFDSASLIVTPNGYKEDKLYSIKPSDGSGDLVVTRATTATRVNSSGLVELVPYNLFTYSQDFTNVAYTSGGTGSVVVTGNYGVAPDGTTTADRLQITRGATYEEFYQRLFIPEGQQCTMSFWAKSLSGTPTLYTAFNSGYFNEVTFTTEWVRYEYTFTTTGSVGNGFNLITWSALTNTSATADLLVWGLQINVGTSAKEYFPTTDRLDVPRLDYTNSSCPSILVEPQRTNLYLGSEDFSLYYNKYQTSILSNTTISPSGLQNADSLIESTSNSTHHIENNFSATSDTSYTLSVFVKQNTRNQYKIFGFSDNGVFNSQIAIYDLVNGTIVSNTGGGIAKIENYGNGWFRCSLTLTSGATGTGYWAHGLSLNGNANYVGDGTSGVYIWGAQLEQGSYATSYIPTIASSVTRNADVFTAVLPNNGMTFTAYLELKEPIDASFAGDWLQIYSVSSILGRAFGYANFMGFANDYGLGFDISNSKKLLWKQESGTTAKIFVDGVLIATSTSGTYSNPFNRLSIYGNFFNKPAKINEFILFDENLTDQQCIDLTTI